MFEILLVLSNVLRSPTIANSRLGISHNHARYCCCVFVSVTSGRGQLVDNLGYSAKTEEEFGDSLTIVIGKYNEKDAIDPAGRNLQIKHQCIIEATYATT